MWLNTMTILIYVKQNVKQYNISLFRDLNKTICSIFSYIRIHDISFLCVLSRLTLLSIYQGHSIIPYDTL